MGTPVRLAISCGDPAGIGPEVALRAVADPDLAATTRLALVGPRAVWDRAARVAGVAPVALRHATFEPAGDETAPPFGTASAASGRIALAALERGCDLVDAGRADALVTAPLAKDAIAAAGSPFRGHTDWLAARYPAAPAVMCFVGGGLRVALVTIHVPLADVPRLVTADAVATTIAALARGLRERFGLPAPRIAVCGLNPHAGEGGLLGREDMERVAPGIARARAAGIDAQGPFPADTLFPRARDGAFDAIVACYHDQGLAPVKALAWHETVNVTLGLPFVRTSPAHGTAWDLAGTGRADARGMGAALRLARDLARAPGSAGP